MLAGGHGSEDEEEDLGNKAGPAHGVFMCMASQPTTA
jgi:hypothetical protein